MWELLEAAADELIGDCSMVRVEGLDTELPRMGAAWSVANSVGLIERLQDHWPDCADDLTPEIRAAMRHGQGLYGAEARMKLERRRAELNEAMARIFDTSAGGVDFVMTATNPDVAFAAEGPLPDTFGGIEAGAKINGRLTFPGQPPRQSGDLDPLGFGRRAPDRPAGGRPPLQRGAAARPRSDRRTQPSVAAHDRHGRRGVVKLGAFSISLAVADLALSRAFYEQLGFEVVGGDAGQNWLILPQRRCDHRLVPRHVRHEHDHPQPGWLPDGTPTADFTDVREVQAHLDAAGVELTERTDPDGTGPGFIVLVDPDGNPVLIDQHVDRPGGKATH